MNRVLVLVPNIELPGGIASYYKALKPYMPDNISYFKRGGRGVKNKFTRFFIFFSDIIRYIFFLTIYKPQKIVINTSIGLEGLRRDLVYIIIASNFFNKRIIVFFRGWDDKIIYRYEKKITRLLKNFYFKSYKIIVLSNDFKNKLISLGYKGNIIIETTTVDDNLLSYNEKVKDNNRKSVLFLSRIERDKGIYETIEAFKSISDSLFNVYLDIAGDGKEFTKLKKYLLKNNYKNVILHGYVTGKEKAKLYKQATVYLLPSYHEGMPNSVLEAMAFGLPIITSRVGGLNDFFVDPKMGLFLNKVTPDEIKEKILFLIDDPELCSAIGSYNKIYAKKQFFSNIVASRFIKHINEE